MRVARAFAQGAATDFDFAPRFVALFFFIDRVWLFVVTLLL
jgi:hypothetical protein